MSDSSLENKNPIVFYDGYCYLCSNTVRLIIWLDRRKKLRFMDLQKAFQHPTLSKLLSIYKSSDTILLYTNSKIYTKSDAILILFKILGRGFKLMGVFFIIPKRYRDLLYDIIAKTRYRIFGKRKKCYYPTEEFTDKYL